MCLCVCARGHKYQGLQGKMETFKSQLSPTQFLRRRLLSCIHWICKQHSLLLPQVFLWSRLRLGCVLLPSLATSSNAAHVNWQWNNDQANIIFSFILTLCLFLSSPFSPYGLIRTAFHPKPDFSWDFNWPSAINSKASQACVRFSAMQHSRTNAAFWSGLTQSLETTQRVETLKIDKS